MDIFVIAAEVIGIVFGFILAAAMLVSLTLFGYMFLISPLINESWFTKPKSKKASLFNRKRIYNYWFKRKYWYKNSSKATIAARRLIQGYFRFRFDKSELWNPLDSIIAIKAKIRSNVFIITVITDKPLLFIGKGGETWDEVDKYILHSNYYKHSKFSKLRIKVKESRYWPETFEELVDLAKPEDWDVPHENTFNL